MALDFDDIKRDISEIMAIGDEALASSRLVALQDKISEDISKQVATEQKLNDEIADLNDKLQKKENENKLIRENNKDLLLRYGQLVTETTAKVQPVEEEEEDKEKNMSWAEIAKME